MRLRPYAHEDDCTTGSHVVGSETLGSFANRRKTREHARQPWTWAALGEFFNRRAYRSMRWAATITNLIEMLKSREKGLIASGRVQKPA